LDLGVWLSLISLVLVIPLGIASNLITPRLVAYLGRRKLIKSNQTKEQDLVSYRRIADFRSGKRDKYVAYIGFAAISADCSVGCATFVLLLAFGYGQSDPDPFGISPRTLSLALMAALLGLCAIISLAAISQTERRIQKFKEYTAEIRAKWGDDVV
jgi:hypothetical protein